MARRRSGWVCQECGKGFKTEKAVEKAWSQGCPKCGGTDVQYVDPCAALSGAGYRCILAAGHVGDHVSTMTAWRA